MKSLLLISAIGAIFSGCGSNPSAETTPGTATTASTTSPNAAENGLGTASTNGIGGSNASGANGVTTPIENGSAPTDNASASNAPTDAEREMAGAQTATASSSGTVQAKPKNGDEVAVMETAQGRVVLMFFPNKAPKAVENFKKLATKGFYDNTAFHRVIPGFMIQGGDPYSDPKREAGPMGTGGPGYQVKAEFNDTKHVRGILSAARSQDPDSAGSQFFICVAPAPFLDNQYTAFGQVVSGMDAVDKLVALPRDGQDKPNAIDQARVKSVRIVKWPVK